MVRDKQDLCISVPSFFKCPISLDIMKSPVNLCTELTTPCFSAIEIFVSASTTMNCRTLAEAIFESGLPHWRIKSRESKLCFFPFRIEFFNSSRLDALENQTTQLRQRFSPEQILPRQNRRLCGSTRSIPRQCRWQSNRGN